MNFESTFIDELSKIAARYAERKETLEEAQRRLGTRYGLLGGAAGGATGLAAALLSGTKKNPVHISRVLGLGTLGSAAGAALGRKAGQAAAALDKEKLRAGSIYKPTTRLERIKRYIKYGNP